MFILRTLSRIFLADANPGNMSTSSGIEIYRNSHKPTKAWTELSVKQKVEKVVPLPPETAISDDKIRFVCISDTHTQIERVPGIVPDGDVLLHAGDFTNVGKFGEIVDFNTFLGKMPHKVKIVIAGNHDMSFDDDMFEKRHDHLHNFGLNVKDVKEKLKGHGVETVKELLTNCVYLEDSSIDVCGIKIYGSPWQPEFCDWGFNLPRGEMCLEKWDLIPINTDILITHGPPIGKQCKAIKAILFVFCRPW
ncbi:Metallophosphoesterase mpped2 [Mactra antiquata]